MKKLHKHRIWSNCNIQGQWEKSIVSSRIKGCGNFDLLVDITGEQMSKSFEKKKWTPASASQFFCLVGWLVSFCFVCTVGWKAEKWGLKWESMACFAHLYGKQPLTLVAHSRHLLLSLGWAVNWNSIAMFWEPVEVRRPSETLFKLTLIQTGNWPLAPGRNSTPVEISLSPFQLS